MKKQNRIINLLSLLYVTLPIMLFFYGWIKLWIAIPVCILICISIILILCRDTDLDFRFFCKENKNIIILVLVIVLVWVYFSGIGGVVFQNRDHYARNAIFDVLVENHWPVIGQVEVDGIEKTTGLIYYIGFWLPAAAVGKVFGLATGYCFQGLWAIAGVFLVYYYISEYIHLVTWKSMVLFIFFGGLDIVGQFYAKGEVLDFNAHMENWSGYFQYSSFTTQLFWVFNQAIYAWIIFMLIIRQKDNKSGFFIMSCGMISCSLPFMGMIPFLIAKWIDNYQKHIRKVGERFGLFGCIKSIISLENIVAGGLISVLSFLYLMGNGSSDKFDMYNDFIIYEYVFVFLLFFFLEAGIYLFLIYRYQKHNWMYYLTFISLFVFPLIRIGVSKDFCMRASIPALIMLYLMVIDSYRQMKKQGHKKLLVALIIVVVLGSFSSIHEINRTAEKTIAGLMEKVDVLEEPISTEQLLRGGNNFSGECEGNFFFEQIAQDK